jgi:DnaJ-class molecular chaperone
MTTDTLSPEAPMQVLWCEACEGWGEVSGHDDWVRCPECDGAGRVYEEASGDARGEKP